MGQHPIPHNLPGYKILNKLGEGTAGVVYSALRTNPASPSAQTKFAVKVIPRSKLRNHTRREVAIHLPLRHPNIIRLHHVAPLHLIPSDPRFPVSPVALALIMDCAPIGDMFTEVSAAAGLPANHLRSRLRQIATALDYLHSKAIAHLDVKLENVVISNSSTAQLIDFGCARHIDHSTNPTSTPPLGGTLQYLPPELIKNSAIPPATSSDAWSFGVLAYTALVGVYPFNGASTNFSPQQSDAATRRRILSKDPHPIPSCVGVPDDIRTLIHGLLHKDPALRMTIPQALQLLSSKNQYNPYITIAQPRPQRSYQHPSSGSRPSSPASPTEADFSEPQFHQTVDDAIKIVDDVKTNNFPNLLRYNHMLAPSNRTHNLITVSDRTK